MAKITEYQEALNLDQNDVFLKDGTGGTKKIKWETLKNIIAPIDDTLSEAGKAADAKEVGDKVADLKSAITETIECASFTDGIDGTYNGLTIRQDTPGVLTIYGVASASRRILCLNGQTGVRTTSSEFDQTLDAGHYSLNFSTSGYIPDNDINWDITYTTFANVIERLNRNRNNLNVTFENPVMIGLSVPSDQNFGTEENPTYVTFSAKELTAVDSKARSEISGLQNEPLLKYSQQTLTLSDRMQSLANIDAACGSAMFPYNAFDLFKLSNIFSKASNGITYTRNDDNSWTIKGTATDASFCNVIPLSPELPAWIVPGAKYRLSFNGGTVPLRLYTYVNGTSTFQTYSADADITLPEALTGLILRFQIASGTSYGEEGVTVMYTMVRVDTGGNIINNSYTYNNTIEKTEEITNNSYTITTSPSITTDTNGWLASVDTNTSDETGKTDMTSAIMAMLNDTGYCHLGEGIFYVSGNIDMPAGSTIEGCGQSTIIRLLARVSSGYTIKMQEYCTLTNLRLSGIYSSATTPSADGGRIGVLFAANSDGQEGATTTTTSHCWMSDVCITGFSGDGLKCHNTSINYAKGLYATNVHIAHCYRGINIDCNSEFNKFTNICISWCYIGCVNNGGNNVFVACTFHATNTGFYIDGTQFNSAHGTVNGCTFCHIGSNNGVAIQCDDVSAGFVFANCQIWYNSVVLNRCTGILFDGIEFGRGISNDGSVCASITISGGNLALFNGCIFHMATTRPPKITITNNSKVRFVGCYDTESGEEITGA